MTKTNEKMTKGFKTWIGKNPRRREFNLSKRIQHYDEDVGIKGDIPTEDVREFIKRLKEDIDKDANHIMGITHTKAIYFKEIIDQLAGEKLIGGEK